MNRGTDEKTGTIGGAMAKNAPVWLPTWPIGAQDDFLSDLPDEEWMRLHRMKRESGPERWKWVLVVAGHAATGVSASREEGEAALMRLLAARSGS